MFGKQEGTYIERVEHLLDHFNNMENRILEKNSQVASLEQQVINLKREQNSLEMTKHDLMNELSAKKVDLRRKEADYQDAQQQKYLLESQNRTLEARCENNQQQIAEKNGLCEVNFCPDVIFWVK